MALEDLLTALEQEAHQQVAARLAAARAEAEAIAADTEARMAEHRAEFVAAREARARAAAELELVKARRDGRRLVLDARAEMLRQVRQAARARLPEVETDPRYRALLPVQLAEALRYLGESECVVRSSSWLEPILAAAARGRAVSRVRTEESGAGGAGFVVEATDGSIRVDMTLDGILDRMWPELAMAIVGSVHGTTSGLPGDTGVPGDAGVPCDTGVPGASAGRGEVAPDDAGGPA